MNLNDYRRAFAHSEELFAPPSYRRASPLERARVCNGCGAAGWQSHLFPNSIWFLDITGPCDVHDWMYDQGRTIEDKEEADRVFLNNQLRLIESQTGFIGRMLKPLRRRRALKYYEAVTHFGGPAFWKGKNP